MLRWHCRSGLLKRLSERLKAPLLRYIAREHARCPAPWSAWIEAVERPARGTVRASFNIAELNLGPGVRVDEAANVTAGHHLSLAKDV
jgi:hypothetical protein